ncbi:2270_t:CDS:2 [Funneliformis geosporum]|uniref:2270_t:CDS:1 n=1 Tax=Funneliformis geosporum TaxID=1117311 RepID=A0A9W4SYM4_9GLOM|nr:2270_t:CDS:2 [Funneliformis geosporum]
MVTNMEQLKGQLEATGNEYEKDYNDPNKGKSQEELKRRAQEIENHRQQVKREIESALNQSPPITKKEIDAIKSRVLSDITAKRNAKNNEQPKDNDKLAIFKRDAIGEIDTKKNAAGLLNESDLDTVNHADIRNRESKKNPQKDQGEVNLTNTETTAQIEERLMKEKPELYRDTIVGALIERMSDYRISPSQLDEETRKLIRGEITDVNKIKEIKDKAIKEIGSADKAKNKITEQIKKDLKEVQSQLKNFKSGTNSYLASTFKKNKDEGEKLEKQLNSCLNNQEIVDFPTTASAQFLVDFCPSQNAFVIKLLAAEKKILLGKTVLDEFACGGTGLYAATGSIFNPYNLACHDTGDSIRRPASYCGIVGFKPSYGLISRAGVIPMASSLDTVGIVAQKTSEVKAVFKIISHQDPHDLLTETNRSRKLVPPKNKIAVVTGIENYLPTELSNLYHHTIKRLERLGYVVEKITIPKKIREHLQITYLILCSSELVSHLNSLQGVTYGVKDKISITQKRSKYLGEIVKQRLLIGAYFLEKQELFIKAQKMRYLVDK